MSLNVFDLIARLGIDTSEYEAGLNRAKSAGSTIGKSLATAAKVGIAAVTAATGATVAFAKSAVDAGQSFDKSMSQVAATMGTTVDQIDELREFAQEMGRTTAFSATQSADALNYMALAGYDAETSMKMLPNVLSLAAAGGMDLARASDMITDTQTAFGISLERTTQMVDEMAKAASTGNTNVEQLGDAFLVVGGLAKELNGGMVTLSDGTQAAVDGVQEMEIVLTAMANAGIKGGEAGTHLRNIITKLSDPTSDGTKSLEAMGVAIFDTEGNMRSLADVFGDLNTAMSSMTQEQRINTITDLFNARDLASAEALLSAVGQDWNHIGESILDAEGAASRMAETQLDNLAGDITLFKSALEGAQIALSDELTPSLRDFVQLGTRGLSEITGAFKSGGLESAMNVFGTILEDALDMVFDKVDVFFDAGGKLIGALGRGLIRNMPKLLEAGKRMLVKLASGMVSNTSALTTKIYSIIDKIIDVFADPQTVRQLALGAVNIITAIANGLVANVGAIVDAAFTIIKALGGALVDALPQLKDVAVDLMRGLTVALTENMPGLAPIFTSLQIAFEGVAAAIETVVGWISSFVTWLGSGSAGAKVLRGVLSSLAMSITAIVVAIKLYHTWTTIVTVATKAWAAIQGVLNAVMAANPIGLVVIAIIALIGAIAALISNWETVAEVAGQVWEGIKNGALAAWEGIKNAFANVGEWFSQKFIAARESITSVWGNIKEFFSGVWNNIKEAFDLGNVFQWGKDMIQNFKDGLMSKWEDLKSGVKGIAEGIKSFLGFSEPDEGPLSNFHTYAPDMMKLFAKGIKDNEKLVYDQLEDSFDFKKRLGSFDDLDVVANGDSRLTLGGTIRVEGVNNEGEFVAASEYAIEEIVTNIMKREARLA